LQAQFAAIGVTLNLVTMVGVLARPEFQKGAFDASVLPANLSVSDPASYVRDYVLGVNNIGPVPPDMAQMASQASVLPLGSNERANAYLQISRYLADKPVASLPGYRGIGIRK
jgi:hypothetical protein